MISFDVPGHVCRMGTTIVVLGHDLEQVGQYVWRVLCRQYTIFSYYAGVWIKKRLTINIYFYMASHMNIVLYISY